ncbi:hypothetical protein J2Y69_003007 [Microbacterium resistens]|uniref:Uncharacterized protein n=1 Tax=Microbacterium resistens TaxID=156977 RepID=A0ABU1SFM5_9MICO|nr:hypothetical protein [Microbacterium resistens]MDR6868391.1 hypothetical protein [Microbacterium resistens]
MSTSDQPEAAPLTRKQLREARLTGANAVITEEQAQTALTAQRERVRSSSTPEPAAPEPVVQEPVAPEPEKAAVEEQPSTSADSAPTSSAPAKSEPSSSASAEERQEADASADGAGSRLTRRQVRERVRTASVPVVSPEEQKTTEQATQQAQSAEPAPASPVSSGPASSSFALPEITPTVDGVTTAPGVAEGIPEVVDADVEEQIENVSASMPVPAFPAWSSKPESPAPVVEGVSVFDAVNRREGTPVPAPAADEDAQVSEPSAPIAKDHTVTEGFGAALLETAPAEEKPRSFDDLLVSDSTGSQHAAPNALIFQQSPGMPSLSGPVAATGEILVTGSYDLPEGLGSQGHAKGTTDGKEVDVVLVDGELPAASSPTPIAASAAISTIKPAGEVIRPPEPEKSGRLMIALTITAGALALALVGALIIAISTGAFS